MKKKYKLLLSISIFIIMAVLAYQLHQNSLEELFYVVSIYSIIPLSLFIIIWLVHPSDFYTSEDVNHLDSALEEVFIDFYKMVEYYCNEGKFNFTIGDVRLGTLKKRQWKRLKGKAIGIYYSIKSGAHIPDDYPEFAIKKTAE